MQPQGDRLGQPGYEKVNAVVEILLTFADGRYAAIPDKYVAKLKELVQKFEKMDKLDMERCLKKSDMRAKASAPLQTRFKAPNRFLVGGATASSPSPRTGRCSAKKTLFISGNMC